MKSEQSLNTRETTAGPGSVPLYELLDCSEITDIAAFLAESVGVSVSVLAFNQAGPKAVAEAMPTIFRPGSGPQRPGENEDPGSVRRHWKAAMQGMERARKSGNESGHDLDGFFTCPITLRYRGKNYPKAAITLDYIGATGDRVDPAIKRSFGLLQHIAQCISGDISARYALLREKAQTRAKVEMFHELRTPMTSIIGFTEMLLHDTEEPLTSNQREFLQKVASNAERLLNLINELLDLSKIDSGKMTLTISPVNIAKVIDQVIDTARPLANDKDLALSADVSSDLPSIRTDEQKLIQILLNLISNAIKFTPGGRVTISAALNENNKAIISVSDTGIGIRRADFSKIFEEFRQLEGPGGRKPGTGLGLAITRKLVQLLGGKIRVSSEIGRGSTFTVTLPISPSKAVISRTTEFAN